METPISTSLSLSERDKANVWHPFTQAKTAFPPIPIVKAKGVYLYSEDGRSYLDGISSWWVNLHGHAHPYIIDKLRAQSEVLEHVLFAGFTHRPAIELAERLLSIVPGNMSKVFYSDNGSTAVEAGIKMAIQYWSNLNQDRKVVISFKGGYHGDTFGAMSAAGPNEFNQPFWKMFFRVIQIDPPFAGEEEKSIFQMKSVLQSEKAACFIFEPLVLGAGGMIRYSAEGLDRLLELCRLENVLTIADEVMTGFGRTEKLFASELLKEPIDIICLSKGLTGGFLPLGATICKESIFNAFLGNDLHQAFLHGHSYTGNPLACSSALASLDLLESDTCASQRRIIADSHEKFCKKWRHHPKLKRCESFGTLLILEYQSCRTSSYFEPMGKKLYSYFLDRQILLRPLGNVLYLMTPYCIQLDELEGIYQQIIPTLEGEL